MSEAGIASGRRVEMLSRRASRARAARAAKSCFDELRFVLVYLVACFIAWEYTGWCMPFCVTALLVVVCLGEIAIRSVKRKQREIDSE